MRFLLGVLVGYTLRGKQKLLIGVLVTLALFVYVVLPTTALLALRLDVQRERRSRPAQTKVPLVKGLTYDDAERKLHAANLNIRLLATHYDPALQPALIIDPTPASGEEVALGYSVGVTVSRRDSLALVHKLKAHALDQISHTLRSWRIQPPCLSMGATLQSFPETRRFSGIYSSEVANMKNVFSLRKRSFLSPVSTGFTSHIFAEVESSNEGEYRWGHNMLTIADCRSRVQIEFFLGTKRERRRSLAKINLLINILTRFRDVLTKEIALIEKAIGK